FEIDLAGTGVAAPQIILSNGAGALINTNNIPSVSDSTTCGIYTLSHVIQRTFYLKNTGGTTLNITATPTITGAGSNYFSLISGLSAPAAGDSSALVIGFNPNAAGTQSVSVNISTNDPNTPIFNLMLQGTG